MNSDDTFRWMNSQGEEFLKCIGIRRNHLVLDFGCRYGTYSIPAAKLVGKGGKIFAVDKNIEYLDRLLNFAKDKGLTNIEVILSSKETSIPFDNQYVDAILLYDVLHLIKNREKLLIELYRILKFGGIFSVYPKHHETEMKMDLAEIKKEIEEVGFRFDLKIFKTLMHDDQLENGYVLNFGKI